MLQVVERAAVGDRRNQSAKLKRGHRDALAEGAHLADAAQLRRKFFAGESPQMLTRNVPSGQLAQSELVRVVAYLFKSQTPAYGLEIGVVRVRQSFGQVDFPAAAKRDGSLLLDDVLVQRGQSDGNFEGRARLRALRERQLLVDHRQDAAALRIDGDDRAVHVPQRIECRATHNRIFAGGHVVRPLAFGKRAGVETLDITPLAAARHGMSHRRRAAGRGGVSRRREPPCGCGAHG